MYGNILDDPLDYIGKVENIEQDYENILKILGVNKTQKKNILRNQRVQHSKPVVDTKTKLIINFIYKNDFLTFKYEKHVS